MKRLMVMLAASFLCCMGCSSATPTSSDPPTPAAHANDSAPSVDEILQKMNDRYASATTYSDEGTLHQVLGRSLVRHETTARLRTRWVASSRSLHFGFHSKDGRSSLDRRLAIWSRDDATKVLFLDETKDEPSLDRALRAMQGVSHGMTGLVPRWLADGKTSTLLKYDFRGEKRCGPTATSTCFMLFARHDGGTVELGVDTKTFALRTYALQQTIVRTREEAQRIFDELPAEARAHGPDKFIETMMAPLNVEETLTLDPVFDAPIADATFDASKGLSPL